MTSPDPSQTPNTSVPRNKCPTRIPPGSHSPGGRRGCPVSLTLRPETGVSVQTPTPVRVTTVRIHSYTCRLTYVDPPALNYSVCGPVWWWTHTIPWRGKVGSNGGGVLLGVSVQGQSFTVGVERIPGEEVEAGSKVPCRGRGSGPRGRGPLTRGRTWETLTTERDYPSRRPDVLGPETRLRLDHVPLQCEGHFVTRKGTQVGPVFPARETTDPRTETGIHGPRPTDCYRFSPKEGR